MKTTTPVSILAAIACAQTAIAQPADLAVDQSQSTIDLTVTLDTPLGTDTDSDSAPITGQMTIELDDYNNPTTITLIGYDFAAGQLDFNFNYGFLGTVNASTANLAMNMPTGAPPATGPVDGAGAFSVDNVQTETAGIIDISGTGTVGALIGATTIDLATLPAQPVTISGTVNTIASEITVTVAFPIDASDTDPDTGVIVTLVGTSTIVATGPIPTAPCLPDVNGDGMVTPTDFTAWINAFNNQLPECDQNSDGSCTPTDFTAWIANFNAGC